MGFAIERLYSDFSTDEHVELIELINGASKVILESHFSYDGILAVVEHVNQAIDDLANDLKQDASYGQSRGDHLKSRGSKRKNDEQGEDEAKSRNLKMHRKRAHRNSGRKVGGEWDAKLWDEHHIIPCLTRGMPASHRTVAQRKFPDV